MWITPTSDIDNVQRLRSEIPTVITQRDNTKMRKRQADTYHHGNLRRTLIEAALQLAAQEKDWNFSLREVARRAGVSHNAPYNHFAHKRDLLDAAAAAGHDLLRSDLTAAVANVMDPRAALSKLGAAYVGFGTRNPVLYRLMFSVAPSGPNWRPEEVLAGEWLAARVVLENILRRGARIGVFDSVLSRNPELQAATLYTWAVVHGLTMLAIDGLANVKRLPMERLAQQVVKRTFGGLAVRTASRNGDVT